MTPADESESEVEIEEDVTVTYPTAVHDVSTVTRVSGAYEHMRMDGRTALIVHNINNRL